LIKNKVGKSITTITIDENILVENNTVAQEVRDNLHHYGIYTLNLISSPGSGKTTLLVETLNYLKGKIQCAVIEGDQQTDHDAQRIASTGVPVIQINTLQSCHLNASQIKEGLNQLPINEIRLLFIENVGNLVCPAGMDIGEDEKVVLMSITEGEDKPVKYPLAFHLAQVLLLTKMDLLPHLRFDIEMCRDYALQINSKLQIIPISVYNQQGLTEWFEYLEQKINIHY
jgi:hydrogenase nickel incorporation protein HypB